MKTTWKKYTKKPLTIEYREVVGHSEKITTVEGVEIWCYSNVHYIMRGTKGEIYPITKAIFNETYTTENEGNEDVLNDHYYTPAPPDPATGCTHQWYDVVGGHKCIGCGMKISLKPNELDRLGIQPGTLTEAEKLEKAKSFIDKVEGSRILHCRHCDYGTRRELELLIHLRKHGYSAPDQSDYWIEKTSDFQW